MVQKIIQTKLTTLAYGINDSATTMRLTNLLKLDGTSMSASDIGELLYGTFDPGTSREEIFSIDGANVTVNADGTVDITSVVRGLQEVSPYTTGGFATDHPAGAVVVFGNNPQLYNALAFLANAQTFSNLQTFTLLPRSNGGNATDGTELVTYMQALALATGTASINRVVVAANAGATVAPGQTVYLDTADQEWKLTDADTAGTVNNVIKGIAQGAGTDGNPITNGVLLFGLDSNQVGMTPGIQYFSNTAGALSNSPGTVEVTAGEAISATEIVFYSQFNQQLTEDQQDALAGTSGTPSTSNKYVTNDDTAENTNSKLVRRKSDGNVTVPTTPTASTDSASKAYVDSQNASLSPTTNNGATYNTYYIDFKNLTWTGTTTDSWSFKEYDSSGSAVGVTAQLPANDGLGGFSTLYTVATGKEIRLKTQMSGDGSAGRLAFGFAESTTNLSAGVTSGTPRAAFVIDNGVIYAVSGDGTTNENTDVDSGLDDGEWNSYLIVVNPGTDTKFYINEVLVATHTDGPINGNAVYAGFGMSASGGTIRASDIIVSLKK